MKALSKKEISFLFLIQINLEIFNFLLINSLKDINYEAFTKLKIKLNVREEQILSKLLKN